MQAGNVIALFITEESGGLMRSVDRIQAVKDRGILGDRYCKMAGTFSSSNIEPDQQITLIEAEAFEYLEETHGIALPRHECRRNIVTRHVDLSNLVGHAFEVGSATLRGIRLCEPCAYLSEMTGHPKLVRQWLHRAGLRAQIISGGSIALNDSIQSGKHQS